MNNVVVTVLYLLRALHQRIIMYHNYIVKNSKRRRLIRASLAKAIYGNKMLDCLLSRSQRLIGYAYFLSSETLLRHLQII